MSQLTSQYIPCDGLMLLIFRPKLRDPAVVNTNSDLGKR
jgi:hypothetical protein